jgi:hypothetical protein
MYINNIFETKEMYFCASLLSYGFSLLGSKKENGVVTFKVIITDKQLLDKLNDDFDTCNLYVNVKRYTKALTQLRQELKKYN